MKYHKVMVMPVLRKFVFGFLACLLVLSSFAPTIYAADATCIEAGLTAAACDSIEAAITNAQNKPSSNEWWNPSLGEFSKKVFESPADEIFGERYTYAQVNWIVNSIFTLLLPRANKLSDVVGLVEIARSLGDTQNSNESESRPAGSDANTAPKNKAQRESVQFLASIFDFPFTHPVASFREETTRTLSQLSIVSEAKAQGIGFGKLTNTTGNIRILWTATRNMAYLVSIILLIASGFMVMFRSKVSPQAVISVQMILPKLAISLFLITFSLAIVGFVIDMVYVSIAFFMGLMNLTIPNFSTNITQDIATLFTAGPGFIGSWFLQGYIVIVIACVILMMYLSAAYIPIVGGLTYAILSIILAILIWALISAIRIVVTLFHAYLNLVILAITGPLQIMADIIPSQKSLGFVPWIKCVIGNASVFVITAILVIFSIVLFDFGGGSAAFRDPIGIRDNLRGLNPSFKLPFVAGEAGGVFGLGDITHFGEQDFGVGLSGQGAGWILSTILLPMAFFQVMPTLMTSVRNALCKQQDPSQQITDMVNNLVKQLSSNRPRTKGEEAKERIGTAPPMRLTPWGP